MSSWSISGNPTEEEVAAIVAALALAGRATSDTTPGGTSRRRTGWRQPWWEGTPSPPSGWRAPVGMGQQNGR